MPNNSSNVRFSLSHKDRVATLTLDKPPLNIVDISTLIQLREALEKVPGTASVVVLRAKGEKAFSAGVDIEDHTPEKLHSMIDSFQNHSPNFRHELYDPLLSRDR